jgi:hypothetical protein
MGGRRSGTERHGRGCSGRCQNHSHALTGGDAIPEHDLPITISAILRHTHEITNARGDLIARAVPHEHPDKSGRLGLLYGISHEHIYSDPDSPSPEPAITQPEPSPFTDPASLRDQG